MTSAKDLQKAADDLEDLQEKVVQELYDVIDLIEIETEYDFVESMAARTDKGQALTDEQWSRVRRLHLKYVK